MVKAVVLKALSLGASPLNNHKVSWLKSERKGLNKTKSHGGVVVVLWCSKPNGEDRFLAGP